jgi:hypothetical protein
MMKMILMLKVVNRNIAVALDTMFVRLIWPSLLPLQSITQQFQRSFTQPSS